MTINIETIWVKSLEWTRDKLLFKNNMMEMSKYIDDLVKRLPNLKKSKR